ncbi:hypothetical protein [Selenomonas sp. oral taxon 478]|uniref:hypothetical protein n=1 Tax=Selenomonas sp. oral taxon 478 TaxID=712538 RepID=UPI00067A0185|nr:hypothetical protein [Selenomonas sp. oral taxon 478]AKT54630.1 hypothetical protein ADJ74_09345 [Selenomonas sp. oral taxon 478]
MKMSSKNTMLTAAVLVALTSGTTYAATPGTVDSQDLFHANRLVTDRANAPAVEERADADHYEASISRQQKDAAVRPLGTAPAKNTPQVTRLRWETVDEGIAERNKEQPSFTLAAQKAQPVIITAADVKREQKLAAKEGRPPQELVGDVNLKRGPMPVAVRQESSPAPQQAPMQTPPPQEHVVPMPPPAAPAAVQAQLPPQPADAEGRPERPRYQQLPREFALNAPATSPAVPQQPQEFSTVGETESHLAPPITEDMSPAPEYTVRPDGVPAFSSAVPVSPAAESLDGISDEVRRHILAGQLAMQVQLKRDASIAGVQALTRALRESTKLTRMQKVDFLIGFGRALHQSGLPRQQESLLIKTIAEAF